MIKQVYEWKEPINPNYLNNLDGISRKYHEKRFNRR
jgi:hypothetical protein